MFRHLTCASLLLLGLAGGACADELKGRFQSIDVDRMTLTLLVDGKEVTRPVAPNARLYDSRGLEIRGGLKTAKSLYKKGEEMSLTVEKQKEGDQIVEAKAAN